MHGGRDTLRHGDGIIAVRADHGRRKCLHLGLGQSHDIASQVVDGDVASPHSDTLRRDEPVLEEHGIGAEREDEIVAALAHCVATR